MLDVRRWKVFSRKDHAASPDRTNIEDMRFLFVVSQNEEDKDSLQKKLDEQVRKRKVGSKLFAGKI